MSGVNTVAILLDVALSFSAKAKIQEQEGIPPQAMPPIDREHGLDDFDEIVRLELEWAAMKAMKAGKKVMTSNDIIKAIHSATELPASAIKSVLVELNAIAYKELSKTGKFAIPQLVMLKLRHKPATQDGKKMLFGKETVVKAKPAKKVVKVFALRALKDAI
jgi:DNA-binding protein HU-beta